VGQTPRVSGLTRRVSGLTPSVSGLTPSVSGQTPSVSGQALSMWGQTPGAHAVNHATGASGKLIEMRERVLPAIFFGGAAGGLARSALEQTWPASGHSWPWVTFAVNLAGTALLASLFALVRRRPAPPPSLLGPLLGVGLCGALTTFSTLQLETVVLIHAGHAAMGVAYALISIGAGLLVARGFSARRPAGSGA
jgi:fluoride exporter